MVGQALKESCVGSSASVVPSEPTLDSKSRHPSSGWLDGGRWYLEPLCKGFNALLIILIIVVILKAVWQILNYDAIE